MSGFRSKHLRYLALPVMGALLLLAAITAGAWQRGVTAERKLVDKPEKGLVYKHLRQSEKDSRCKGKMEIVDEAGIATGCTHGPDPTPEGLTVAYQPPPRPQARPQNGGLAQAPSSVLCAGDGVTGRRFEVIYARASDKPDRYAQYLDSFRQYMNTANELVRQSGLQTGQARQIRFVTEPVPGSGCQVAVRNAVLPPTGDDDIYETRKELRNLGYTNPDYKYVVLADASVYCGIAEFWFDDFPSPGNYSNRNLGGSMYSRVDTPCWDSGTTIAHEIVHSLGGVQDSAPNATAGGHCKDEYDTMCYQDSPDEVMQYICPSTQEQRLDCNKNDYFNTAPPAGSYLDAYWNVARNSYLIKGDAADNTAPVVNFSSLSGGAHVRGTLNPALSIADGEELMRVRFYMDEVLISQDSVYPFSDLSWPTTSYSQGVHSIRADAMDASGNIGSSATVSVTIDNSAPSAPANLRTTLLAPGRADLAWNASSDNLGNVTYVVKRDGVAIGTTSATSYSDTTASELRGYNYQVQAKDQAGNTADSQTLYVLVPGTPDTEVPVVTLTGPGSSAMVWADETTGTIDVEAEATDNQGIAKVELYVNGVLYGNLAASGGAGYSTKWLSINLNPGVYTLAARAYDWNGNSRLSDPAEVNLAVPVHRLYRAEPGRHFYTGSSAERDIAAQGPYRYEGVAFYGRPAAASGFSAVYRLYSEATNGHFYTVSPAERDFALSIGYRDEGIAFYAANQSAGGVYTAVYRLYSAASRAHFFTANSSERDYAASAGFTYEGIAFYARAAPPSQIAPVYRLYNPFAGSHFYTASKAEHDSAVRSGFRSEGSRFYARIAPAYGQAPVHRLYNPATGAHFYTLSASERDVAIAAYGFKYEGIAFYGGGGNGYGQAPVYRLYRPLSGHFYTSSYLERLMAEWNGFKYEGTAYFAYD